MGADRNQEAVTRKDELNNVRMKAYEAPRLIVHGKVVDLTRASAGDISDGFSGSTLG